MNKVNPKQVIQIYNILRALGLNTTLKGTKLINTAIQIVIKSDNEYIVLKDVYKNISKNYYKSTPKQIENFIAYALNSRIEEKSRKNFEKIFNFEYDEYYFTNKTIIEEIARIIKIESVS